MKDLPVLRKMYATDMLPEMMELLSDPEVRSCPPVPELRNSILGSKVCELAVSETEDGHMSVSLGHEIDPDLKNGLIEFAFENSWWLSFPAYQLLLGAGFDMAATISTLQKSTSLLRFADLESSDHDRFVAMYPDGIPAENLEIFTDENGLSTVIFTSSFSADIEARIVTAIEVVGDPSLVGCPAHVMNSKSDRGLRNMLETFWVEYIDAVYS